MTIRLFLAINFSVETHARLTALREELRSYSQSGNFTHDANLHLTLAFIGEVNPEKTEKIKTVMNTINFDRFPATIERLGTFSRGTLWWAGLHAEKSLTSLQSEIEHKLMLGGLIKGGREYHPHITLGREVVTDRKPWLIEPFGETISKIHLMKSERIGGKLTYTSIYEKGEGK